MEQDDLTRQGGEVAFEVRAIVESYDNRPDQCTLYPVTVSEDDERLTTWITAESGSFVDTWAMR